MTYYLSRDEAEGRQVIDTVLHGEKEESVEAGCWIEAKFLLGFELTLLQARILADRG